jgi:hypothetical protein
MGSEARTHLLRIERTFVSIFAVGLRFRDWFACFVDYFMFKEDFVCQFRQIHFLYRLFKFGINRHSLIGFFDQVGHQHCLDDFSWEIPLFSRKVFFEFFGPLIEKQVGLHIQRVYGMLQWSQNREAKQKRATLITVAGKKLKLGPTGKAHPDWLTVASKDESDLGTLCFFLFGANLKRRDWKKKTGERSSWVRVLAAF